MLLYLPLFIKLCYCGSFTSLEIFDVFDPNTQLELPSTTRHVKTSRNVVIASPTVIGSNVTEKTSNNIDSLNGNTTTSINKQRKTKWIFNTYGFSKTGDDKKQFINAYENSSNKSHIKIQPNNISEFAENETANTNVVLNVNNFNDSSLVEINGTFYNKSGTLPAFDIPPASLVCPEEEPPANIGPYEVPTQRDVVIHMRNHLSSMFYGFHTRAIHFLKDVQEATQASWSRKMFCRGPTELMLYRRCVRWVGDLSVLTTKSLVTALETARHKIAKFMQGKICSISGLDIDPINLIRILAAEKVSLEFALPDFLRQLDACSRHCPSTRLTLPQEYLRTSHLTDEDFVIRHYLTQQNYNKQLQQKYKN